MTRTETRLPHALADILKALIWTAPDPVSTWSKEQGLGGGACHQDLWDWLLNQLIRTHSSLGSDMCMELSKNIAGRLKLSTLDCSLSLATSLLRFTDLIIQRYPSLEVCNLLPSAWALIHQKVALNRSSSPFTFSISWRLRQLLLSSACKTLDICSWYKDSGRYESSFGPLASFQLGLEMHKNPQRLQSLLELSIRSYHFLGENMVLLGVYSGQLQSPIRSSADVSGLEQVLAKLSVTLTSDSPALQSAALATLVKIGIRLTNETVTDVANKGIILQSVCFIADLLRSYCVQISSIDQVSRSAQGLLASESVKRNLDVETSWREKLQNRRNLMADPGQRVEGGVDFGAGLGLTYPEDAAYAFQYLQVLSYLRNIFFLSFSFISLWHRNY